ncbi:ABC-2 type transport system ATP-binding protein [Natranaerovirga pectinivora]|uniref:ABC-2 type transport system ATP-binding protein n=1 Tax=Natranaerovirga pectinivora TaxID=682400 RepID=A0A4R3MIR5_9FIRM|nr:ABC transporter ATP-binding protein [Natranaerovirga pectinivora]TCT12286.1 ABC-2 type transport system ATP-binding protein [Natranaerovirga pectinivora]
MAIIEVKNITKRFGNKIVLDNVSFNIHKGDIYGLIGPNGAGKSTLINIMTGVLESQGGDIIIDGFSIKENPLEAKRRIGLVPQEIALMETVSAYENLEFFGALYHLKGPLLKKRITEVLELTGLEEKRKEKVKKFSGGMKRRLNLAVALLHYPEILIMDEPTVGIDPQSRNHIFEFVKNINKEKGTTILYTSHYMEEVELLCNELFIMDLGKEVASGEKQMVKSLAGGNSRIQLKTFGATRETEKSLRELKGVKACQIEEDSIVLMIEDKEFQLEVLLKILEQKQIKIKGINFQEPSLEEVFLSLTGKSLRE